MKTLDEVISTMEKFWICPSSDEADEYCELLSIQGDALQYLKWYKDLADDSEAFVAWKENPPLTWDELKGMKGKPVWVENLFYKKWLIAYQINENDIIFDGNGFYTQAFVIDYGKSWQAYRKERG